MSCFGNDQTSDSGDNWKITVDKKASKEWIQDVKFTLQHVDTGAYLMTHDKKYGRPIPNQQEIAAIPKKSADAVWLATEGILFPPREAKSTSNREEL